MRRLPSFSVRNLGPIAEGTVKLHPLTILVGKNNTGKTYMAQAIYAAYKALERVNGSVEPLMTVDESNELLGRLKNERGVNTDALRGPLRSKTQSWTDQRLHEVGRLLEDRLTVYFDLDELNELKRWGSSDPLDISVTAGSPEAQDTFLFGLQQKVDLDRTELPTIVASDFKDTMIAEMLTDVVIQVPERATSRQSDMVSRRASSLLADFLWDEHLLRSAGLEGVAHYLPAGRSGLLEAWTDVVRLRLEQDRDGLAPRGRESAALGGIALDFLLELQELTRPSLARHRRRRFRPAGPRRHTGLRETAGHLEHLINGEVGLARGRESLPSLTYTQGGRSIPVQRASSMVAELAPLLSWIKHLLSPGDLLLIDEPEAHLHPEAVLIVAQTLVSLSAAGVRVLCTTHSSELLHQVSNCMLRSAPRVAMAGTNDPKIDAGDLGAYRFVPREDSSGTIVVPIDVDPDWGIPEDEHVAVAEHLAEETSVLVDSRR